jgi:hypothetical protein
MPYGGGMARYRETCAAVAINGYEGFALSVSAALSTRLEIKAQSSK